MKSGQLIQNSSSCSAADLRLKLTPRGRGNNVLSFERQAATNLEQAFLLPSAQIRSI